MSEFKGTPGPWSVDTDIDDGYGDEGVISHWVRGAPHPNAPGFDGLVVASVVADCVENSEANAKLIAGAPKLLEALKAILDNAEQRAFEDWLARTTPSGDCDSVHAQWLESSDYEDFSSDWDLQIAAIARATA